MAKVINIRRSGDIVKLSMYNTNNNNDKYFEMEAPAKDPDKVALLLSVAFEKGLARPVRKSSGWWDDNKV